MNDSYLTVGACVIFMGFCCIAFVIAAMSLPANDDEGETSLSHGAEGGSAATEPIDRNE